MKIKDIMTTEVISVDKDHDLRHILNLMKKHDIKPFPSIQAILCTSENIYPGQRELLEEVFQCRVYTFYGHAERVVSAGECEKSTYYHVFPEYGIMELIKEGGKTAQSDGDSGIIVGTGLTNYIMPLIRYRTDDIGVYTNEKCSCNREYQLLKEVEALVEKCKKKDKYIGTFTDTFEAAQRFKAMGVKYISYQTDVGIFADSCKEILDRLRRL